MNNINLKQSITEYILQIDKIEDMGIRLDKFLSNSLPFSRSLIQKWLDSDYITVNDVFQLPKYKTKIGDIIHIKAISSLQEMSFSPQEIDLEVIFNDKDICILNKPAGLVTHPGPGNWQGTLLNSLLYHFPETKDVPRAGIVHRLDKMTSGLMVVAKNLQSQNLLVEQMQKREIKRQYLAIVQGNTLLKGVINQSIGRHPVHKTKMAIVPNGKFARTHYKRLANIVTDNNQSKTLVECTLETGRTHQIRVHMNHIGHALLGDSVYNTHDKHSNFAKVQRQALHAVRLALVHPINGSKINVYIEPSDDLMYEALEEFQEIMEDDLYELYI